MDKNKKIIIEVIILLFIIVIGIVVTYKLIENSVTNRENYKVNIENISSTPVDTVNLEESTISYDDEIFSQRKISFVSNAIDVIVDTIK